MGLSHHDIFNILCKWVIRQWDTYLRVSGYKPHPYGHVCLRHVDMLSERDYSHSPFPLVGIYVSITAQSYPSPEDLRHRLCSFVIDIT